MFLAILHALRPNVVDLTRARTRTNRQNLEEAFHIAERELHIPRLLDPAGKCVFVLCNCTVSCAVFFKCVLLFSMNMILPYDNSVFVFQMLMLGILMKSLL